MIFAWDYMVLWQYGQLEKMITFIARKYEQIPPLLYSAGQESS